MERGMGDDFANDIALDDSGNVYVTGDSWGGGGTGRDYCTIKYVQTKSGVEDQTDKTGIPYECALSQNYPNPFNSSTTIPYTVYGSRFIVHGLIHTTLKIYNIKGQLVRTLVDEEKSPGNYDIIWDGKDDSGKEVASGTYFYRIKTKDFSESKKLVLLK